MKLIILHNLHWQSSHFCLFASTSRCFLAYLEIGRVIHSATLHKRIFGLTQSYFNLKLINSYFVFRAWFSPKKLNSAKLINLYVNSKKKLKRIFSSHFIHFSSKCVKLYYTFTGINFNIK